MKKAMPALLVVLCTTFSSVYPQIVRNIKAVQDGDNIQITYDLDDAARKDFFVRAYASNDGGKSFNIGVSRAEGDVNGIVKSGTQKKILWHAAEELGEYQGMMRFKIVGVSTTAAGKSENQDFILGLIEIKKIDKDDVVMAVSLFAKREVTTSFMANSFLIDNYGNHYKLSSGVIGTQTVGSKQAFHPNDFTYGELVFRMFKKNPSYTGGAAEEFQVRIEYDAGGSLYCPKVAVQKQ